MSRARLRVLVCLCVAMCAASGSPPTLVDAIDWSDEAPRWKLSRKLQEISGLARTEDGRLLAHDDEFGIVYEIESEGGELVKAFALGTPTVRADFEGIAVAEGRVYLVTSDGRIYEALEGADGDRVRFNRFDAGIGEQCREVEGLAYEPAGALLLLPCKRPPRGARDQVSVLRFSLRSRELAPTLRLDASALLLEGQSTGDFRPTAIERDPTSGHYLLLSARTRSVAEVTPEGRVLAVRALPDDRHPQAEGLAIGARTVLVADEGLGSKRGRLTRYTGPPPSGAGADAGDGSDP